MNRKAASWYESNLASAGLFLATAGLLPLLHAGAATSTSTALLHGPGSDPLARRLWYLVYAAVLVMLVRRSTETLAILARQKLLVALVGLAAASAAWSTAPSLTFERAVALALTTAFAILLATRFSPREILRLIAVVLGALALVSVGLVLLDPGLGLDRAHANAWRGAFTHKNELGRMMTFSALVWFLRFWHGHGRRGISLTFTSLSLVLVAGSGSRTSLAALLVLGALLLVTRVARAEDGIALPLLTLTVLALGCAGAWSVTHAGSVTSFFGASSTLTGRTRIWSAAWMMAKQHLWLGYGYDAFWRGLDGPSARVWAIVQSTPPHAHNGFLDLWLDLGAVGVALFVATLVTSVLAAYRRLRVQRDEASVFFAVLLGYLVFFNITESALLARNSIFWIAYVAVSVQLSEAPSRARRAEYIAVRPSGVAAGARP